MTYRKKKIYRGSKKIISCQRETVCKDGETEGKYIRDIKERDKSRENQRQAMRHREDRERNGRMGKGSERQIPSMREKCLRET